MGQVVKMPLASDGIYSRVDRKLTGEFVTVKGYNAAQRAILGATVDDVELTVNLETYERMENDPTITKSKKIIITNVLTDEIQLAPSANEDEIDEADFAKYVEILEFAERCISGLEKPYRSTLEQLLGNGIRYGHGLGEIEWEYKYDGPNNVKAEEPKKLVNTTPAPKGFFASMLGRFGYGPQIADDNIVPNEPQQKLDNKRRNGQQLRLMPKKIMVKPRGAALFVVDQYMNEIGIIPRNNSLRYVPDQIKDRRKFIVLTLNKQDEDPRGRSFYRPAFNWYNLKTQMPGEMLKYILEEVVPKAVATLPEEMKPYEVVTDENGDVVYTDATRTEAKLVPTVVSFKNQIQDFKSGSGAIIPFGSKLEPFRKSGSTDANILNIIITIIEKQMENALLLQNLAQSEGEHQARSASSTHKELLEAMSFWIRWLIAVMTSQELIKSAIEFNYGPEWIKYMPFISLGDFVRRDWARDVEVVAKAYFYGFLDDTQRAELMAWLNFPKPGPSRFELGQDALAQADANGEPVMPNQSRPDKQSGNKNRNDGNSTEKKKNVKVNKNTGLGPLDFLGHHGKRFVGVAGNILNGRR